MRGAIDIEMLKTSLHADIFLNYNAMFLVILIALLAVFQGVSCGISEKFCMLRKYLLFKFCR